MSSRNHGIPVSFPLNKETVTAKKIGQLVAINADGEASTETSSNSTFVLPLIEDIDVNHSHTADVTIVGVAKVFVEDAAGIAAGLPVGIGATGLGVELYSAGAMVGIALEKPKGSNDSIRVLLTPSSKGTIY